MRGAGPVDDDPEFLRFTRAERSGFLGPIFEVHQIANKFDLWQGKKPCTLTTFPPFNKEIHLDQGKASYGTTMETTT